MLTTDDREGGFRLLDAVWEAGIRTLDSSHIYGGGACDRVIGAWMQCRTDGVAGAAHGRDAEMTGEPWFLRRDLQARLPHRRPRTSCGWPPDCPERTTTNNGWRVSQPKGRAMTVPSQARRLPSSMFKHMFCRHRRNSGIADSSVRAPGTRLGRPGSENRRKWDRPWMNAPSATGAPV